MNMVQGIRDHVSRRAFLKGTLLTAGGMVIGNWGGLFASQTIAAEAARRSKRCILLWMNGGASQIDTFDMKPGTDNGGPFRPVQTKVPGLGICEYLPKVSQQADKLAIIRSMKTTQPDHPDGIRSMHVGHKLEASINHPEIGAVIAK